MSRVIGAVGVALVAASVVLDFVLALNQPLGDAIFVAVVLSGLLAMLQTHVSRILTKLGVRDRL